MGKCPSIALCIGQEQSVPMKSEVVSAEEVNTGNGLINPIGQAFKEASYKLYYMLGMAACFCLVWFAFPSDAS